MDYLWKMNFTLQILCTFCILIYNTDYKWDEK